MGKVFRLLLWFVSIEVSDFGLDAGRLEQPGGLEKYEPCRTFSSSISPANSNSNAPFSAKFSKFNC